MRPRSPRPEGASALFGDDARRELAWVAGVAGRETYESPTILVSTRLVREIAAYLEWLERRAFEREKEGTE